MQCVDVEHEQRNRVSGSHRELDVEVNMGLIEKLRRDHSLLCGTVAYLLLATIAYVWFQGRINQWYYVHSIVVVVSLTTASPLFIPLLSSVIAKSRYEIIEIETTDTTGLYE